MCLKGRIFKRTWRSSRGWKIRASLTFLLPFSLSSTVHELKPLSISLPFHLPHTHRWGGRLPRLLEDRVQRGEPRILAGL